MLIWLQGCFFIFIHGRASRGVMDFWEMNKLWCSTTILLRALDWEQHLQFFKVLHWDSAKGLEGGFQTEKKTSTETRNTLKECLRKLIWLNVQWFIYKWVWGGARGHIYIWSECSELSLDCLCVWKSSLIICFVDLMMNSWNIPWRIKKKNGTHITLIILNRLGIWLHIVRSKLQWSE